MKKLLTEPEKDVEALLRNDTIWRQQEELRRLLAEREASQRIEVATTYYNMWISLPSQNQIS